MKKIIAILAIFMIIAVSGCVEEQQVSGPRGYGLEIVNFTSNLYEVYSDKTVIITMQVENHGETKIDKDYGLALLIIPSDWDVTQEKNQAYKKDITFEDELTGTAAGTEFFRWTVKSPPLAQGLTRTDTITGRIYYDYETSATGNIWIYPESEAFSDQEKNVQLNTLSYEKSRGPIDIDISVMPDPVLVYYDQELFTLTITLTNIGDGVVYAPDEITSTIYDLDDDKRNVIDLDIRLGDNLDIEDNSCYQDVTFFGDTATVICDIEVEDAPSTKQQFPITVTANYGYYKDEDIEVTTIGREEREEYEPEEEEEEEEEQLDYVLDAKIEMQGTTQTPGNAQEIDYCPLSSGSKFKFSVPVVGPDGAEIHVEELADDFETSNTIEEGATWDTETPRAKLRIKIIDIDTSAKVVEADIEIREVKVAFEDYRFTYLGDYKDVRSPDGDVYRVELDSYYNETSGTLPVPLISATFKIGTNTLTVNRSEEDKCIRTQLLGSGEYLAIGIDDAAQGVDALRVPTIIAIGTTEQAAENAVKNGFYSWSDSCSSLTQITFDINC